MQQDTSRPEDADKAEQAPEPAPTDLRRHIWLLLVILFVVLLSWVLSLASRMFRDAPAPGLSATRTPDARRY